MITDSKKLSGACECGRKHAMTTEFCVIESGAMFGYRKYADKYGLCGKSAAIYDENTYRATADRRPETDCEIVLPPEDCTRTKTESPQLSKKYRTERTTSSP